LPCKEGQRGVAGNTEVVGKRAIMEALLQQFRVCQIILSRENLYLTGCNFHYLAPMSEVRAASYTQLTNPARNHQACKLFAGHRAV
jgi:hypothetical protein